MSKLLKHASFLFLFFFLLQSFSFAQSKSEPQLALEDTVQAEGAVTGATGPATGPTDAETPVASELADVSDFGQLDLAALLDTRVETASRKAEPISRAPAVIGVVTRQQIYDLGATSLYDALTFLPGIEVIQSYLGYPTFIFRGQLQEIYNSKILFLINGHPSYEVINSSFYLEQIPIEAIERIEVIRGPGSVLYGTNAFAGVINIITRERDTEGNTTAARLQGGSFTTIEGGAGNYGNYGDLKYAFFAGAKSSKGYDYTIRKSQNEDCFAPPSDVVFEKYCTGPGPSAELDYFQNFGAAFGDLQYKGLRLQGGFLSEEVQKYGIIPVVRFGGPNEYMHGWLDLSYRHEWDDWSISGRLGYDESYRIWAFGNFPLPSFDKTIADNNSLLTQGEFIASWNPAKEFQLEQGISASRSTAEYYDVIFEKSGASHPLAPHFIDEKGNDKIPTQLTASYFLQGTYKPTPKFTLVAGNRTTWFQTDRLDVKLDPAGGSPLQRVVTDDPTLNNSPRGAVVYAPWDELVLKLLYGTAFRLPTQFETSAVFNQIVGTTEDLVPEIIRTFEMGIDSRPHERISLRVNGYYSLTDDLIIRRPPTGAEAALFGDTATVWDNGSGQSIIGLEIAGRYVLSAHWSFFANGDYKVVRDRNVTTSFKPVTQCFSEDERNETGIADEVACLTASGGLKYAPASWVAFKPNAQFFGRRGDAGGYALVNTVIDFPISEAVTVSAIGNNLTDRNFLYPEYIRGVIDTLPGGPGRAFYARVVAQF